MRSAITTLCAVTGNRCMVRVLASWLLFVINEYGVWTAVLVYAFERGGTAEAAAASVAQLLPAAVLSPLLATVADRRSPSLLLRGGYLAQIGGLVLAAAPMLTSGPSVLVYLGAVVASTAVGTTRPAHSLVVPGVARSARELSAANAAFGWLENVGTVVAGVLAGGLLMTGQPGWVLVAGAAGLVVAVVLIAPVRVQRLAVAPETGPEPGVWRSLQEVAGLLRRAGRPRALVALITAAWLVVGALDVLFVVLAVDVLGLGTSWAGYFTTAFGVGGVIAVGVTVVLLNHRLGTPTVLAAGVLAAALATTAVSPNVLCTVLLVVLLGASRSVLEVTATTLVQRTVPTTLVGRVFGLIEGLSMAAMAVGALAVPLLAAWGGPSLALIGVSVVIPVTLLGCGRVVLHLDDGRRAPLVELSLLRSIPQLAALPTAALESLAVLLVRVDVDRGGVVMRQGERGDSFFAIAGGEAEILVDGERVGTRRRGEGLGDVGELAAGPRTATVFAQTPLVLYELGGEAFVRVVRAHADVR